MGKLASVKLSVLILLGVFSICGTASASEEDILRITKFRYESHSMHADFVSAYVEGERSGDDRLVALDMGFNDVQVTVDQTILEQIPAHAVFLQMTGELGFPIIGGKTLTVYFQSPISPDDRTCFRNSYLSVNEVGDVDIRHSQRACRTLPSQTKTE